MSTREPGRASARLRSACSACLRRSWLLAQLSVPLEYLARDRARLYAALELEDRELLRALGGRRRQELETQLAEFEPELEERERCVCVHHSRYPAALRDARGVAALHVAGGVGRLERMTSAPIVAVVGSERPSDYGVATATAIARGLAASGVTLVSGVADGVAAAALAGALETGTGALALLGGGLQARVAVRHRELLGAVLRDGCALAELPRECGGRRWGALAGERLAAALAAVTVVVEARDEEGELWAPRLAGGYGRALAAVPGRVSSPLAGGPNALLARGARLIRDPGDVLDLLSELAAPGGGATPSLRRSDAHALEPRLRAVLDQVGAGLDRPESLVAAGMRASDALLAVSELEVMGLLRRGVGGRYVPTQRTA